MLQRSYPCLEPMLIDVLLPPQAPMPPPHSVAMAPTGALIAVALCLSVVAVVGAQGKGKDNIAFGNDASYYHTRR